MIVLIDNYDSFTFNLFHYLGELGGGCRRASQRQDFRRCGDRRRTGSHRAIARPLHAERSRHLPRPHRQGRAHDPDPRRLPRPSGDRTGLWRQGGARASRRTARCLRSATAGPACFAASTDRFAPRAIIRWWSSAPACRARSTVNAETDDHLVMGLAHASLPVHGVQFHPESIASEHGHLMLKNFLDLATAWNQQRGRTSNAAAARKSPAYAAG